MKRRHFFKAASSMVLPILVDGFGVKSYAKDSALVRSLLQTTALNNDRILVMIYLGGGNDGLNTVIPLDQYAAYNNLRSNIAIPENKVLPLSGNAATGLHPSMTGMRDLYNQGKLAIVNSVSYPNPDQSHYRSTDIWMTGSDSDKYVSSGWAGRYLNRRYPGYPVNYPNTEMEDPLAIQIGYMSTTTLLGDQQSAAINIKNPAEFYQMIGTPKSEFAEELPWGDAGVMVNYIKQQQALSIGYASEIKKAADAGSNMATYPATSENNDLAEQLKIVARLIHGGLKSKIYYVEIGGFDTHANQVGATSVLDGSHAKLLKKLSDAMAAFQNDLKLQGTEDKVIGMTFSDFGRRATSNGSKGTDHGVGAPMFVFGTGIKRQVIGTNPDLVNGLLLPSSPRDTNRDIKMQIDFRRVYADMLNDWFGTSDPSASQVLFKEFKTTSLFSDEVQTLASGSWPNPEIWSNGRVPAITDKVKINTGHIVEVGQNLTIKNLQINGEVKLLGNYVITTNS